MFCSVWLSFVNFADLFRFVVFFLFFILILFFLSARAPQVKPTLDKLISDFGDGGAL